MATAADAIAQAADVMESLDPAQIEAGRPDGAPELRPEGLRRKMGLPGQGTLLPAAPAAQAAHAAHAWWCLMVPEAQVIQQREQLRQHAAEAV